MPPTGVFSSWLTLATKSRRTSSTRRALVRSSTRSSTWATPSGATRARDGDPAASERAAGQVELGLADHAVAADLAGQVPQLGVGQLGVADQAVDDRGRAGLDDGVGRVDDDAAGAQDREHVGDARRQRGARPARGSARCGRSDEPHAADRDRRR